MFRFLTTAHHGGSLAAYIAVTVALFVALMAVLHATPSSFKKQLTIVLAFIAGFFYLLEFLIPAQIHIGGRAYDNFLTPYITPVANAKLIFLALAWFLGAVNLFRINGRMLFRRKPGWHNAVAFFVGFFAMGVYGLLTYYHPDNKQYAGWYKVLFEGAFNGLSSTVFALLAFYIVSAAYRAFRVRNTEAILLLASALIMMLGLTPLGTAFITGHIPINSPYAFLKLENIAEWILSVLNGAAQRALLFGVAVGVLATSLRIWLSLERGQFFDADMTDDGMSSSGSTGRATKPIARER